MCVAMCLAIGVAIGVAMCVAPAGAAAAEAGGQPPNIVLILADDMGYGDVAHAGGKVPTPHIDRLAGEGMRFTDAHTPSSVCTPTRYALLTGRYSWRSRLKRGVLSPPSDPLIEPGRATIAGFLKEAGYVTSVIGKWHLGLDWQRLPDGRKRTATTGATKGPCWELDYTKQVNGGPLALGFSHDFLFPASLDMPPYVYLRDDVPVGVPTLTKAFKTPNRPGPALAEFEAERCLADFARESRAFIGAQAAKGAPFFLYLPLTSPHTPIVPSGRWQGKSAIGDYGDFIMETDWVVGEVLAELEARGVADNTLIIFTADNGCSPAAGIPRLEEQGHVPNGPWRGHKADIYEGGHRVPFLVRWPGQAAPGSESARTLCLTDCFATIAAVLGRRPGTDTAVDSFSFLPELRGQPGQPRAPVIHHSINGSFAIRSGDWKLCLCPGSGGWSQPVPKVARADASLPPVQLFNLADDPGETLNLAPREPERVRSLAAAVARMIALGRSTPGPDQPFEGWPDTFPPAVTDAYPALSGTHESGSDGLAPGKR